MRIGIVSDIHCNIRGLEIALQRIGDVDELLCAGDSVFEYRFSNEVMEALRARGAHYVLGNHEAVLLGPNGKRARENPNVRAENLEYMATTPLQIEVDIAGKRLLMVHASPFEPHNQYVYPNSPEIARLATVEADYIILGHTHYQMAEQVGRALVINPGSAGDPRDDRNGRLLSCAVLDTSSGEVVFHDFPNPLTS